jgi:hypothetical protein
MRTFISYRRADSNDAAHAIYRYLATKHGKTNTFIDVDTISKGVDFDAALANAISKTDVLLALIGPRWLEVPPGRSRPRLFEADDFVRKEIVLAIEHGLPIIPLLIGDTQKPLPPQMPKEVIRIWRNKAYILGSASDQSELERLNSRMLRLPRRFRPWRWFFYGTAIASVFLLLTVPTLIVPLRAIEQPDSYYGRAPVGEVTSVYIQMLGDNEFVVDGRRSDAKDLPMYVSASCYKRPGSDPCGPEAMKIVIVPSPSTKPEAIVSLMQLLQKNHFFRVVLAPPPESK